MPKITIKPSIFRDYDIRAVVTQQLDSNGVRRIAQGIIQVFQPKSIQVGHDMRVSSPEFHEVFIDELMHYGVDVIDLGLISTDMLYYAAGTYEEDMAVTISASHNPPEYNGLKMVKRGAAAIGGDSGIYEIRDFALSDSTIPEVEKRGTLQKRDIMEGWINHLLSFVDISKMKNLQVVSDTGNGMAGHFMPQLEEKLPWKVTRLYYELDGTFPNHIPSPIEEKNMKDCIATVLKENADVGMAFDGDGDRVFLVDDKGRVLSGTVMTAIIAENLLQKHHGETILYNAIVGRIVPEIVEKYKGKAIRVRVGHALIKEAMRKENGLFCGEHSGHYYFRNNFYADSAIIAALLVLELQSELNVTLSELHDKYLKYSASGEINFEVTDKDAVMKHIESIYSGDAEHVDKLDGVSIWFPGYWFNIRPSNTEPLLRLNLEANSKALMKEKVEDLVSLIEDKGGIIKK